MENQLQPINQVGVPAQVAEAGAYASLEAQVKAMGDAYQLAQALCKTSMVPKQYQGRPEEGAAAILYGAELGLNAIQSLQQVIVINGKPAIEARTAAGLLIRFGCQLRTIESSPTQVTVQGTRAATGADETVTWTIERAQQAGYTSNRLYKTIPEQMLYAKAVMEVARKIAPDILSGIAYSVEELRAENYLTDPGMAPSAGADQVQAGRRRVQAQRQDRPRDVPVEDQAAVAAGEVSETLFGAGNPPQPPQTVSNKRSNAGGGVE